MTFHRNRSRWITAAVLFAVLTVGCKRQDQAPESTTKHATTERTLGCITALTGKDANYGRSTRGGLELALAEVNAELVGSDKDYRYSIVYEDDQMIPKEGYSAYQKLTSVNNVAVILGPFGSKVVNAVAPHAERGKTILLSASATDDSIADAGDFVFRTVPPNKAQGRDCAQFARQTLGFKNASILYVNDVYGVTLKRSFIEAFAAAGGSILTEDAYDSQKTDFRTQLTRIKTAKPDFVFFPGYYKEPALILKQAADLGLQEAGIKFIGTDGSCTDDLIRIAGPASEGAYFSNLSADFAGTDPRMRHFIDAYTTKYETVPDAYAAYYYDAMKMFAFACANVDWDTADRTATAERVRDALYAMPPYQGVTGTTKFDKNGEVDKHFAIMRVESGRFIPN